VPQDVFEAYLEDADEEDKYAEEPDEDEDDEESEAPEEAEPVTPFADPPTGPFDPSDLAAWQWLRSTFAAVVTALDAELGRLFDELRPRGLDQTAAWVVTSDLGYPLGEHGQVGLHRPWLHEELVHVPLLVRLPGAAEAGRHIPAFTQPADLAPTLLDLFGVFPIPESIQGHSLLPLARGEVASVRPYACSGLEANGAAEWSIRTDDRALLVPDHPHPGDPPRERLLFEKPDDRWEVNDLRTRNVERADELEEVLRKAVATVQRPGPLTLPEPDPDPRHDNRTDSR
jgi:arylsulfatase A-like enzyme